MVEEGDLCDEITEKTPEQVENPVEVPSAPTTAVAVNPAEVIPSTDTTGTASGVVDGTPSQEDTDCETTETDIPDLEVGVVPANPETTVEAHQVEECDSGYLVLRSPSCLPRQVPNCCAVCLCPYEVGDKVVWSSNRHCNHAFHQDCMLDWLTKMQDGTPCPCCRQAFTDLEAVRKQRRITWDPNSAFNPSAISF